MCIADKEKGGFPMESIPQIARRFVENMKDFSSWEDEVHGFSLEISQWFGPMVLKAVDDRLMEEREEGLAVVGKRKLTITAMFGSVTIERRLYRDREGNYRFLLDEALGLMPGKRLSPKLAEMALELASQSSFRFAARVISKFTKERISHMTLHNMVASCGDEKNEEEERQRAALFESGELPPSENREVERLMVEADGVGIALQREKKKRAEIKLAVAYEGWEPDGKARFRTVGKTVHSGLCPGEEFWQDFSVTLAKKYRLPGVSELILGGDGASWITSGSSLLPFKCFQLDRFHLSRALRTALGPDKGKVAIAYRSACGGDAGRLEEVLNEAEASSSGEKKERIRKTRTYLARNRNGLADWRKVTGAGEEARGMGVIETNGDKLLANRVKKKGMSWTEKGADRMAKVIQLEANGELHDWVRHHAGRQAQPQLLEPALMKVRIHLEKDPQDWLAAHIPAIEGPHSDRYWVSILRELSRIPEAV